MPILITGLFAPSGGAGAFDLYAPEDIESGSELWALDEDNRHAIRLIIDSPEAPRDKDGVPVRVWVRYLLPACLRRPLTTAEAKTAFRLMRFALQEVVAKRPDLLDATCGGVLFGEPLAAFQGFYTKGQTAVRPNSLAPLLYNTVSYIINKVVAAGG